MFFHHVSAHPGMARYYLAAAAVTVLVPLSAQAESIVVASTTSTENSGLFSEILPKFTDKTGIEVRVVAQGTGQALETGRRGDADVVFVHNTEAEQAFVGNGYGVERVEVMYNDFILVGPEEDPAGARGDDIVTALGRLAEHEAQFISRGDDSGTHAAELGFWEMAGVKGKGAGYQECGCGMGPALNMAASANAYALADRGTWLSFENRRDLDVLVEGDERLFNQYGVMLVNPERHSHVKAEAGQQFIDWLVSDEGQEAIGAFTIGGERLFIPNAND